MENPETLKKLKKLCDKYYSTVARQGEDFEETKQCIFEAALQYCLGDDVFPRMYSEYEANKRKT